MPTLQVGSCNMPSVRLVASITIAGVLASASVGKTNLQSKAPTTDSVADLVKVVGLCMFAD